MFISDLIIKDKEQILLDDLFLSPENNAKIRQYVKEHIYINELQRYGLPVNNKILLHGSSGCGKTAVAKAIAGEVQKELLILNLSNVVCARMGETAQNVKMVFERAAKDKSVLFLDEFDQVAKLRNLDDKDAGEMRRLVTTIIQLIDYMPQDCLLLCATNYKDFIDPAILRRFQIKLGFEMPARETLDKYYNKLLAGFPPKLRNIQRAYEISFAEARDHSLTAIKSSLIRDIESQ